jgi:hypothetical protein
LLRGSGRKVFDDVSAEAVRVLVLDVFRIDVDVGPGPVFV